MLRPEHGNEVEQFYTNGELYRFLKLFLDRPNLPMHAFSYMDARQIANAPDMSVQEKIIELSGILHEDSLRRFAKMGPPDFPAREMIIDVT